MADTKRILLVVAYDGTDYHGWQAQDGKKTIEGELNNAIEKLTGNKTEVIGASRTDAGVHGLCNLAVFDTDMNIEPSNISRALNSILPNDIVVRRSLEVDADFHPRKRKTSKTYRYRIDNEPYPDPLKTRYAWFVSYDLDVDKMRQAAGCLIGEHDFSSFCAAGSTAQTHVRSVDSIEIGQNGPDICIDVTGGGFLYNMVRIIAGTLVDVGRGRIEPENVKDILESKDRTKAGLTAPPQGLTLINIEWDM